MCKTYRVSPVVCIMLGLSRATCICKCQIVQQKQQQKELNLQQLFVFYHWLHFIVKFMDYKDVGALEEKEISAAHFQPQGEIWGCVQLCGRENPFTQVVSVLVSWWSRVRHRHSSQWATGRSLTQLSTHIICVLWDACGQTTVHRKSGPFLLWFHWLIFLFIFTCRTMFITPNLSLLPVTAEFQLLLLLLF